ELHLPMNLRLLGVPWEAGVVRAIVGGVEAALPAGAWPTLVLGNHDEPRIATRAGADQAAVAMTLLLTLRGTPFIYYGDELGLPNASVPVEHQDDPLAQRMP